MTASSARTRGALAPAMAAYRRAIALRPDYAEAHNALGQAHLLSGDFAPGWRHCEWRWPDACPPQPLTVPLWRGEDIAGKTVLLFHEQGLGDTVQFVRYVRPVAALGARVVLAVQPPLAALLRGLPEARVVTAGERLPAVDLQAPLLGVPRLLGTTLATIPAEVPYLRAAADRPRPWLERLAGPGLKVGVAWAGNPRHLKDSARSIPWEVFRALVVLPGIRVFSLQLGSNAPLGRGMVDLAPLLGDFADTAAALERLDLCISADTAVAHLAGALGRPLWALLPFMPDWRWLLGRADSPWYPTARLFRQAGPGDWAGVIDQVTTALRRMI